MVSILNQAMGKLFDQVIALHKKNTATLGFLPRGAFEEKAKVGKILTFREGSEVLGYLLYDINGRNQLAYIVHLCVHSDHLGKGIATRLFQYMESHLAGKVCGIRVHCRIDYEAAKVWPRLGFRKIKEIEGRMKGGSRLGVWRKDLPFPDLFAEPKPKLDMVRAGVDYNILADILKPVCETNMAAHAMMEDWLVEEVDLYVTPEVQMELQRDGNPQRQRDTEHLVSSAFKIVSSASYQFEQHRNTLRALFADSDQDLSDLAHVAWCAADGIGFFVTSDENLCKKSIRVYDKVGVKIIHPAEFVSHIHFYLKADEYQPQRFQHTELMFEPLKATEIDATVSALVGSVPEGTRKLREKLRSMVGNPTRTKTLRLSLKEQILAVITIDNSQRDCLMVPFFRTPRMRLEETIAIAIVNWLIGRCVSGGLGCIRVIDNNVTPEVVRALSRFGFARVEKSFVRWVARGRMTIDELLSLANTQRMRSLLSSSYCSALRQELERVRGTGDDGLLLSLEKRIWPMKIKDLKLPCYVVSIRSQYAIHLFDLDLSAQDLFGGDPSLLLNFENAYYKSRAGTRLKAPARILWYVSKGHGRHQSIMAIRAASYLDEVHEDTPKILFDRFQHLGVYMWKDVREAAHNNSTTPLIAFTFSGCEILDKKINRQQLNQIWQEEFARNFNIYCPLPIADNLYWKLYDLGQGLTPSE